MPATTVSGSPNISLFDSKVLSDLCTGKFYIDVTTSVFINAGASNIQGIKIQIKNPYGVEIKSYGSLFDIPAPATAIFEYTIPTQAGKPQYGKYLVSLQITDEIGNVYEVVKVVDVCTYTEDQNPCDDRVKLNASCKNGWLTVEVAEPPVFKGIYSESRVQEWTVNFPTKSGVAAIVSTHGHFSVQLFEGVYLVEGDVCAKYHMGDNVYLNLPYSASVEKNVKCNLDYSCIWPKITQLNKKIASDCSEAEKAESLSLALYSLLALKSAELANDAGEDAGEHINELERLLGCVCTCDCSGLPIVNGSPSSNIAIEGCNITKETVGLTDIYTIDNYEYIVAVNDITGAIGVSAPAISACKKTQTLTFNPANAYTAIKGQVNNADQYNFWASIVNRVLDPIISTCLGYSALQWANLTFFQRINAIVAKACTGSTCSAIITSSNYTKVGGNVVIDWVSNGALYVEVWVDGILMGAQDSSGGDGSFAIYGYADGFNHSYVLKPFCSNSVLGVPAPGSFQELACPTIAAPNVSSNAANGVACPFDLTGLVAPLPAGVTAEWHTLNNTLSTSLVGDATEVIDGVYWVFAKDGNGCYSMGVQVTVTCQTAGTVTAPQNLQATPVTGSVLVRFASAAFPPASNSYTIKRRLASAPDVIGSYTTLGSTGTGISFNASTNLWELNDTTAASSTLYVYRAISNGGSSPYIDINYANISCPAITYSKPAPTTIAYSFVDVGGNVDKYEIELYNSDGTVFITRNTHLKGSPGFPNPITGNFPGLAYGNYQLRAKVYVGSFVVVCPFTAFELPQNRITGPAHWIEYATYGGNIEVNDPAGATLTLFVYSGASGNVTLSVVVTGSGTHVAEVHSGNPGDQNTVNIFLAAGTYAYSGTMSGGGLPQTGLMTISN